MIQWARPFISSMTTNRSAQRWGECSRPSGFQIESYSSGEELLARLPRGSGCILLDLQMPGLSGLELQARLADLAPLLPIVFLTGRGDIGITVRAMKAGAHDFLEKPASSAAVLEAVERARCSFVRRDAWSTIAPKRCILFLPA